MLYKIKIIDRNFKRKSGFFQVKMYIVCYNDSDLLKIKTSLVRGS